jgi:hypothetical protein
MNKLILVICVSILLTFCQGKSVDKVLKLANFKKEGPFIFMTKLHLGAGGGQMDISYMYHFINLVRVTKSTPSNSMKT